MSLINLNFISGRITGRRPEFVISDRVRYVNIDQLFLISYIKLLIKVCHKRGALATGGMAALVLDGDDSKYVSENTIDELLCDIETKIWLNVFV